MKRKLIARINKSLKYFNLVSGKYMEYCQVALDNANSNQHGFVYTLNDKLVEDYSLVGLASTTM